MSASRISVLLLTSAVGGCMTGPRPVQHTPKDYLSANQPGQVWVTLTNGTQTVITGPRVITDTVFGWSADGTRDVMIAVSDIKEVRARRMDTFRTALIPASVLVGTMAIYLLVADDGSTSDLSPADCEAAEIEPEECARL